jgi:hypothetical protein
VIRTEDGACAGMNGFEFAFVEMVFVHVLELKFVNSADSR